MTPARRFAAGIILAFGFLMVAANVGAAAPAHASSGLRTAVGPGLLLTASPAQGVAPLLVDFSLQTPNQSATSYSWTFGDGSYLNGSGAALESPSHVYQTAGSYNATVVARWPFGPENASIEIVVASSVLSAGLHASPTSGAVPLTVWFNASPQGGSGTYLSFGWQFGDGGVGSGLSVRYTYLTAGHFVANFTVTDTSNGSSRSSVNITVLANSTPGGSSARNNSSGSGSSGGGATSLLGRLESPAIAVLVGGLAVFGTSAAWVLQRRRSWPSTSTSREPQPPEGATAASPRTLIPPEVPSASPRGAAAASDLLPPTFLDQRRLAVQLLRHLGTLPQGSLAPGVERTQAGLADALGVGQSTVSRVLRRLILAGIVETESTHVVGSGRRMRVYRLTERGTRVARALPELEPASDRGA